jgi:hypothetical protein
MLLPIAGEKLAKEAPAKKPAAKLQRKSAQSGSAAMMQFAPSAERSGLPEMERVGSEFPGHGVHVALACFKRNLLGEHDVSDRQSADRQETQSFLQAASFVDLAHVHRGPGMNPVPPSAVASDNIEIALPAEHLALRWRKPLPQQPQRPTLRRALGAVPDEEGSRRPHAGAAARRPPSKAEHSRAGYPPTSLGKKIVSPAVGSKDRRCEA